MKWVWRILGVLAALCVLPFVGLWLAGMRPGHGHVVAEVVIDRPAAQVFRWLMDDDLAKKWIGGLEEIREVSAPAGGGEVGKKLRLIESYNGQRVEMDMEVTKFEKDRALSVLVSSVGDPKNGFTEMGDYTLAEQGGKTRVRFEV